MTEADWWACDDPIRMLGALRGRTSERTLRLFAVACCRSIWNLLDDDRSRSAVAVAEQYADGTVGRERLIAARRAKDMQIRVRHRRLTGPTSLESVPNASGNERIVPDC